MESAIHNQTTKLDGNFLAKLVQIKINFSFFCLLL